MDIDSSEPMTDVQEKPRKERNTDHKVLRIHTEDAQNDETAEGEFVERKTRPKRLKRKAAGETSEAMDTEATVPKKPHFAKLAVSQQMVGVFLVIALLNLLSVYYSCPLLVVHCHSLLRYQL